MESPNANGEEYSYEQELAEVNDQVIFAYLRKQGKVPVVRRPGIKDPFSGKPEEKPEGDSSENSSGDPGKQNKMGMILLILGVLIVVAVVAIVVILYLWNKGTASSYDASAVHEEYDIEVQDNIIAQNPSDLEGIADDGVTKILYLGNDMITDDLTETGIPGQSKLLLDADGISSEYVSAAFPSSQVTCFNENYSDATPHDRDDIFNFFYVANCISTGDFSPLTNVAAYHSDDTRFQDAANALASLDLTSVDMIVIAYNGQDYINGAVPLDLSNPNNIASYSGALTLGIERIREACPWIRLVFLSPTYTQITDENGELKNGDTVDLSGNGTMPTYWYEAIDVCCSEQVSFIDNYYGSVNGKNYEECMNDGIHLNAKGNEIIAKHFVYKIFENGKGEFNYVTGTGSNVSDSGAAE